MDQENTYNHLLFPHEFTHWEWGMGNLRCVRGKEEIMAAATVGAVWLWWQSHRIMSSGNDFIRRACGNLVPGNCVCGGD